jgi:hypothetical protein
VRIEGDRLSGAIGLYRVEAVLICTKLQISKVVEFMVDTGSSYTAILDKDVDKLGINYDDLEEAEEDVTGIGGDATTYLLPKSKLIFTDNKGHEFPEDLDTGMVLRHSFKNEKERHNIFTLSSLLGMDILHKYKIHFNNFTVFLDL